MKLAGENKIGNRSIELIVVTSLIPIQNAVIENIDNTINEINSIIMRPITFSPFD